MPLETDQNCDHVAAYTCSTCDAIHIASFGADHALTGQVLVQRENLNALIVELMKLRDSDD